MRPACRRLILLPANASGLARYRAISICCRDTPSGLFCAAILPSVSPFLTSCVPAAFAGAGASGRWTICGWARTSGARAGAGAAALGAGAGVAAIGGGPLYSGGSSRKVYSRTRRPAFQLNSTSMSRNGSLTGCVVLSLSTALPARLSTAKRRPSNTGLNSMLASRNAAFGASRAARESSSPGCRDTISISADSGCPSAESTVNLPKPAESAKPGAKAKATAAASRFAVKDFPTAPP